MKVKRKLVIELEDEVEIMKINDLRSEDDFGKQSMKAIKSHFMYDKAKVISSKYEIKC